MHTTTYHNHIGNRDFKNKLHIDELVENILPVVWSCSRSGLIMRLSEAACNVFMLFCPYDVDVC